ncbi:MAG: YHS domain-containing protein [Candidatus Aminicenantales bacterium]
MRHSRILVLLLAFSFIVVLSGIAQQQAEETVTCPVSGKVIKKSEAKATYEYNGKTYYFCSETCKEKFIKNPEKYIKKEAKGKACGSMMGFMGLKDVDVNIENLDNGVIVKIMSKDPDTVKKIQENVAKMNKMMGKHKAKTCKEKVKKEEKKK